jgi:hypothetical protein
LYAKKGGTDWEKCGLGIDDNLGQVSGRNAPRRLPLGSHNENVRKRVLHQILSGASDANVRFEDLRSLLNSFGFAERTRGDHHIFSKAGIAEILNLQPRGSLAKPYQVKQVRTVIVRYKLAEGIE